MSGKSRKPELFIKKGSDSFSEIRDRSARAIIEQIEKFNLPIPKMSTKLTQEIALTVEQHFAKEALEYVSTRLNEQIDRYVDIGMAGYAGYSGDGFRAKLQPLVDRVMGFFAPPACHPIVRGEFTLLLVLPIEWVSLRRQMVTLMDQLSERSLIVSPRGKYDGLEEFPSNAFELRKHGKPSPKEPYVLVGINGGRALRGSSILQADTSVEKFGCTYLSVHQMVQLLLVRPGFLFPAHDTLPEMGDMFALGETCPKGIVRFVAQKGELVIDYMDEKNLRGGVEVGKPYYTTMIT